MSRRHLTRPGPSPPAPAPSTGQSTAHDHKHTPGHAHDGHVHGNDHDHAHGIFHTHAHDHHEGAEQIIQALRSGRLDRGTRITLLGLGSNVALTVSKGVAGLWMNSASLLAEAGHSLSDLLGDFVTLATWRISRRPPSDTFPWGYSKFETCGTLAVSVILVGGAVGIGLHSYHLLLQTLLPYLESLPADSTLHELAAYLPSSVPSPLLELFHSHGPSALPHDHSHSHAADVLSASASLPAEAHGHGHDALLNPHAAWFALASVIIKEWLYRLTARVAAEEHSPVLRANALHHRADALTSLVALGSILGSSIGGFTFLDPLGGLAVSFFILQQGLSLSKVAVMELLDVGIEAKTQKAIEDVVNGEVDGESLLGCRNVRGVRSGGQTLLDLTITVPAAMTVRDSHAVEQRVRDAVMLARKEVREVKIHVHAADDDDERTASSEAGEARKIRNDFGRDGC
ncbi:mitochondrial metal transporter [Cryptotrichosporon argae]